MVACEIANPLIHFPSLPEYSFSQAAIGPLKPFVAGPPPFLNEDVDNYAAESYPGRNRSGQNDNQGILDEALGMELDSLFANKTLPKIDLSSSTEFSFSIIMIERDCSDALRN